MNNLHGVERVEEMKRLRHIENWTLDAIGREFGNITRERVRQLIGNTGRGFQTRRRKMIWQENKHKTNEELGEAMGISSQTSIFKYRQGERHDAKDGSNHKVNYDHVKFFSDVLTQKGISHEIMKARHPFDILLSDGTRIEVLSNRGFQLPGGYATCRSFNTRQDVKGRHCDYFACIISDTLEIFIIPAHLTRINSPIRFCHPTTHHRKSKWLQYQDRFDLLR